MPRTHSLNPGCRSQEWRWKPALRVPGWLCGRARIMSCAAKARQNSLCHTLPAALGAQIPHMDDSNRCVDQCGSGGGLLLQPQAVLNPQARILTARSQLAQVQLCPPAVTLLDDVQLTPISQGQLVPLRAAFANHRHG